MPRCLFSLVIFAALFLSRPALAREAAVIDSNYRGAHQDDYLRQSDRVRILVRQAQLEVSVRLGLYQYQEGFQYPLTIRFQDDAPVGVEHALAFVRLLQTPSGFQQELVVNLGEMANRPADLDVVFYHEMTHAVLNDAVGGPASQRIPTWVQEGLAQYVSGEGDRRVRAAAEKTPWAS